jgi:hypothetical protein
MESMIWLVCAGAAIIYFLHKPLNLQVSDLPGLFSDEPEGIVELRPDLAVERNADESYQLRTMRLVVTYSIQCNTAQLTERFEMRYRGKPGPMLDMDDGWPISFGVESAEKKTRFSSREIRDAQAFAHLVRMCVHHRRF